MCWVRSAKHHLGTCLLVVKPLPHLAEAEHTDDVLPTRTATPAETWPRKHLLDCGLVWERRDVLTFMVIWDLVCKKCLSVYAVSSKTWAWPMWLNRSLYGSGHYCIVSPGPTAPPPQRSSSIPFHQSPTGGAGQGGAAGCTHQLSYFRSLRMVPSSSIWCSSRRFSSSDPSQMWMCSG